MSKDKLDRGDRVALIASLVMVWGGSLVFCLSFALLAVVKGRLLRRDVQAVRSTEFSCDTANSDGLIWDGEFEEFVTRGVPLEPASGDVGRSGRVVDYDALRAILDQRGLDAQERQLIERYFEAIAQGES